MATIWTTIEDVKNRWADNAPIQPPTDEKIALYIEDIEAQILGRYPNLQERIDNNSLSLTRVKSATSAWIMEYIQTGSNPYAQESQSYTGAMARSVTYDSKSRKSLILSSADLDIFMPANQGKAFSLSMSEDPKRNPDWWYLVWSPETGTVRRWNDDPTELWRV